MDFATKYDKKSDQYISVPGEQTLQDYNYKFDKEGHKQLVPADTKTYVYDRIQADKDSCDINLLMKRFAMGDTEVLNVNKGVYVDARKMPKTMAEVFEKGLEAEQYFNGLPVEVKEMFDNSHSVFFTEMGSKAFDEKIQKYNDSFIDHSFDAPVGDSEVKADE